MLDEQNVGNHKMNTDSVYFVQKRLDFSTILAVERR